MRPATSSSPVATATPPITATTSVGSETTAAAGTTTIGTTTTAPLPPLNEVTVALTSVTDLDGPIVLAPRSGDDAFYIGERRGVVYAVSDERGDVVLDISDRTTTDGERGLLGLAFSPDGTRLYISSTDDDGDSVIEEYLVDANGVADVGTRRTVITVDQPFQNHNGGHITFGPDGYLYFGLGDGGSADDPDRRALDPSMLLGKLLRIDPMTPSGDLGYTVPADNPLSAWTTPGPRSGRAACATPGASRSTPPRVTCGSATSAKANGRRSISPAAAAGAGRGVSFGWSAYEGTHRFNDDQPADGHVAPLLEYPHGPGCSVDRRVRVPGHAPARPRRRLRVRRLLLGTDLGGAGRRRRRDRGGRDRQRRQSGVVR